MSEGNIDMVRRLYDSLDQAYQTGEYSQVIEDVCHPDVVLKTSGMFPESGEYTGYDGLAEFARNQAEALDEMWVEPTEFVDADSRVVVPLRFGGKARHSGIETAFAVVHVWTIGEGRVSGLDMYRDRAEALKAVGLE
jgi:ketosteroid isomerase-like protein